MHNLQLEQFSQLLIQLEHAVCTWRQFFLTECYPSSVLMYTSLLLQYTVRLVLPCLMVIILKSPFLTASFSGSGNVLKVQQLLHICSEHYEAKEKEKEEDKDKKDKKDKDKKESAADMGSHQVKIIMIILKHQLFRFLYLMSNGLLNFIVFLSGCGCSWYCPHCHGGRDWL